MQPTNEEPGLFSNKNADPVWEPTDDEIACALELNTLSTFRTQFRWLRTKFKSFQAILEAPPDELNVIPERSAFLKKRFIEHRAMLTVGTERAKVPSEVDVITYFDSRYPATLKELHTPPPVLFVRGDLNYEFCSSISIVGTRSFTDYGRQMAEHFAYQLAGWGFTIVSGGARGIDSIAHKSALQAAGKTIAVLGCGIDFVFPRENEKLFDEIAEKGALVTEFPMGSVPEKFNFPARNRLIASLGRGTLIIEAAEKSGALITADHALQTGREVFAVPGRITDGRSRGTNRLIQDGAHIALDSTDIPIRFGLIVIEGASPDSDKAAEQLTGDEALVYEAVGLEAKDTDDIVREVGIPAQRVLAALLILQTKGLVRELPGSRFVRPVGTLKSPN